MPTYTYECRECESQQDERHKISEMDDFVAKCVECGSEDMYRIITGGTGFVLKGSGWSGRDLKEKNQREKRAEKMQKKMEDNSGNHKRRQRTKEEFGL